MGAAPIPWSFVGLRGGYARYDIDFTESPWKPAPAGLLARRSIRGIHGDQIFPPDLESAFHAVDQVQ